MTCPTHSNKTAGYVPHRQSLKSLFKIVALLCLGAIHCHAAKDIKIQGRRLLRLPSIEVSASPQQIHSGPQTLFLQNGRNTNGWLVTSEIIDGCLKGHFSNETIPATLSFQSVTWLKGGNRSAAGISIHSNGTAVEADPGFGIGVFIIKYEIRYDAPAFPAADRYRGISTFIVQ